MARYIKKHVRPLRSRSLPGDVREQLKKARVQHGWSQGELGKRVSLPQQHISGIESGKIVPRFDTLVEVARVLDQDVLLVPRELTAIVQTMVHDFRSGHTEDEDRPLYALDSGEDAS